MTEPTPLIAEVKIPIFNHADPALWFSMCESTFELGTPKAITDSKTKYNYCVSSLPPETASLVRDVLMQPAAEDPYGNLKETLATRSGESGHQEIRRLLQGENIGDRRPTELLRVMKRRATAHQVPDKLMLELFLQHLPAHVQTVLAAVPELSLDKAAEIADRVMEVSPVAVSACSATTSQSSIEGMLIEELKKKLNSKFDEFARGRKQTRERSFQKRQRSKSKYKNHDLCWYHFKFGNEAQNCAKPCKFETKNENRQG